MNRMAQSACEFQSHVTALLVIQMVIVGTLGIPGIGNLQCKDGSTVDGISMTEMSKVPLFANAGIAHPVTDASCENDMDACLKETFTYTSKRADRTTATVTMKHCQYHKEKCEGFIHGGGTTCKRLADYEGYDHVLTERTRCCCYAEMCNDARRLAVPLGFVVVAVFVTVQ